MRDYINEIIDIHHRTTNANFSRLLGLTLAQLNTSSWLRGEIKSIFKIKREINLDNPL